MSAKRRSPTTRKRAERLKKQYENTGKFQHDLKYFGIYFGRNKMRVSVPTVTKPSTLLKRYLVVQLQMNTSSRKNLLRLAKNVLNSFYRTVSAMMQKAILRHLKHGAMAKMKCAGKQWKQQLNGF